MSCFWDTLLQSKLFKVKSSIEIISFLKKNKRRTNCLVNGKQLSTKQIEENLQAIASLDEKKHNHGYMTSMCEPVLCFMCDFFSVFVGGSRYFPNTLRSLAGLKGLVRYSFEPLIMPICRSAAPRLPVNITTGTSDNSPFFLIVDNTS